MCKWDRNKLPFQKLWLNVRNILSTITCFDSYRDSDPMTFFLLFMLLLIAHSYVSLILFIKFRSHSTIRKVNRYRSFWALQFECNITCDCMRFYQSHFVRHPSHIISKAAVKWWVQTKKFSGATKNTLNVYAFE